MQESQFQSGEVAWLLQNSQSEHAWEAWGQTVEAGADDTDSDDYPVLTDSAEKKVYKVTFEAYENPSVELYMNSTPIKIPETNPTTDTPNYHFARWATADSPDAPEFTSVSEDTTVYAIFEEDLVHGRVTKGGAPVPNASVTLKQGGKEVGSVKANENGYYTFPEAEPGVYDIVVETENGQTMTSMVTVTESESGETVEKQDLELPAADVSSVLKTEEGSDLVHAVGGLDTLAEEHADPSVDSVTVSMSIEKADEATAESAEAIKAKSRGRELEFFEIDLKKVIKTSSGGEQTEEISTTKAPLTIVLSFAFAGRTQVEVLRYHDTGVDILTETKNEDDEFIELDKVNDTITLHVKNFSTYAIGYYLEGKEHVTHKADTWQQDEAAGQHYKICTVCGDEFDRGYHTGGAWQPDMANNQHYMICTVCDKEFARKDHTGDWQQDTANNQHFRFCTDCETEYARGNHVWKLQSTDETTGDRTYICEECGVQDIVAGNKHNVSGKVVQKDGTPAAGAHVELVQGGKVVAETTTDENGNYSFSDVEPGTYNLVVETEDRSTTVPTEIGEEKTGTEEPITLPESGVKSELKVEGENTPNVTVSGLTEEAEAQKTPGNTVALTLTVESKPENQATNATEIRKEAGEDADITYLDIQVAKSENGGTAAPLAETKNALEIVIPYDVSNKEDIVVYRSVNGVVEALTTTPNADGEYIEVRDNAIVLHVKHAGTYAIGHRSNSEEPASYIVMVEASNNGKVTASVATAKQGDTVTLTATPDDGYKIKSVTVMDSNNNIVPVTDNGDGTYTFTMPAGNATVTATFVKIAYSVLIPGENISGSGSVVPDRTEAAEGDAVTLTATPADGYKVESVTVKGSNNNVVPVTDNGDGTYTFTMPGGNATVTATFVKKVYSVLVSSENISGSGSVVPDRTEVAEGDTVTLTVTLGDGYKIESVTVKDSNNKDVPVTDNGDGTYTFTQPAGAVTVSATFVKEEPVRYTVIIPASDSGTVEASPTTAAAGDTVTLTVTPDDGYKVESVTVKDSTGIDVPVTDNGDGTYTFKQPAGAVTVTATFVKEAYSVLIPSEDITGRGSVVTDRAEAAEGETVTLTITPERGYYLYSLKVLDQDGNPVALTRTGRNTYTFTQPAGGVTVKATFAVIHYSEPEPTPTPTPTPSTTPVTPSIPATPSNPAPATYSVAVPEKSDGGSVAVEPKDAAEGTNVKLTVQLEKDYHLDTLTVLDKDGKAIALKNNQDGTYTFTMPAGTVSVETTFVKCTTVSFPDLDSTAWYHEHTDYVISHGLMNGNEKGLFEPNGTVTRAQMVTLLWNLKGKPVVNFYMTYSDVSEENWYAEAIRWATSEGIVSGCGDGSFGPNDTITREQMATMIYQYEKKYGDGGFTGNWMFRMPFNDLDQVSEWAYEGVAWCYMRDVITGKDNDLMDPKGHATRAEMAAILTQYLKKDAEDEEDPA